MPEGKRGGRSNQGSGHVPVKDIRAYKQRLREKIKSQRRSLPAAVKEGRDRRVRNHMLRLRQYQSASTVLAYMSTTIEVDTRSILEDALKKGKRVALPRCVPGTRLMEFYYIRSFDELEKGAYGILEPCAACEPCRDFQGSICIVPALCYDRSGYRLGYGGGYYDRFLSGYPGIKIGIIYAQNLCRALTHGKFDQHVDLVVSDRGFFYASSPSRCSRTHRNAPDKDGAQKT